MMMMLMVMVVMMFLLGLGLNLLLSRLNNLLLFFSGDFSLSCLRNSNLDFLRFGLDDRWLLLLFLLNSLNNGGRLLLLLNAKLGIDILQGFVNSLFAIAGVLVALLVLGINSNAHIVAVEVDAGARLEGLLDKILSLLIDGNLAGHGDIVQLGHAHSRFLL